MKEIKTGDNEHSIILPTAMVLFVAEKKLSREQRLREAARGQRAEKRKSSAARLEEQRNNYAGSRK